MASPTFKAAGTPTVISTSASIPRPSVVADDLMILVVVADYSDAAITASGWTLIQSEDPNASAGNETAAYYKVAGGSEPSDYTVSIAGGTSQAGSACILVWDGDVDTADPIDVSAKQGNGTQSDNIECPSVTTTVADTTLVCVYGTRTRGTVNYTAPSGMTERLDSGTGAATFGVADLAVAAIGATGTKTAVVDPTGAGGIFSNTITFAIGSVAPAGPTLTSPTATGITATGATVGATTDTASGTLYVVVTTSATQPSSAQIKAGQSHTGAAAVFAANQAVSSTGAKTSNATGLTASTTYYAHWIHDSSGDSNILSSSAFATAPTLSSPTVSATGNTTATCGATTTGANGTMYFLRRTGGSPASGATIVATGNSLAVSSSGAKILAMTGFTTDTAYITDIVHADSAGTLSNVVSTSSFTPSTLALTGSLSAQSGLNGATLTWTGATPASLVTGNGIGSRTWSLVDADGSGISAVNSSTGVPSAGTLVTGTYTVDLQVTDSSTAGTNPTGGGSPPQTRPISFSLTVTAAPTGPTINTQPQSITVINPATAGFTLAATTSGGALSYQWRRNGTPISGATSSSYTTPATTRTGGSANNGDVYTCAVTDSNGTTVSSGATLSVAYGFPLDTAVGAIVGNISGSLVGLGRDAGGTSITLRVYNPTTGAPVTSQALATVAGGRLPRWGDMTLDSAVTYDCMLKWADGDIESFRLAPT
jgi:hypothetical protein